MSEHQLDVVARPELNGHQPRIPFGDLPNQTMPLEWAEQFIRIVYAEQPGVFRAILPRLYGLPEPEPKRRRNE